MPRCGRCQNSRYCGRSCLKRHWGHGHSMLCGVIFDRSKRFGSPPVETARPAITKCKKCGLSVACDEVVYFDCCSGELCMECAPIGVPGVVQPVQPVQPCPLCDKYIWLADSVTQLMRAAERGDTYARRLLTHRCLERSELQCDLDMDTVTARLRGGVGKEAYTIGMLYSDESFGRLNFAKATDSYRYAHEGGDHRAATKLAALYAGFVPNEALAETYSEVSASQPHASAWAIYRHACYQRNGTSSTLDLAETALIAR